VRYARRGFLLAVIASGVIAASMPGMLGTAVAAAAAGQHSSAPAAPGVVLINRPARSICVGHTFTVGVWFQQASGGSRAYRVAISGPRHRRFFYRYGRAPLNHWRFWKVLAGRIGIYRIIYSGHRPGSTTWSRFLVTTRARRC
jgi:hypothetical protein